MFDLDAYLERLGLDGRPNLARIHRAQVCSIPFENLDPHDGIAVSLDEGALQGKLVTARRGGYCFEQNLLLAAALEDVGVAVEPMLARVRWGAAPGVVTPRTHLVLRVRADDAVWLADVGFGAGTLLEPIPFGPGGPYEQAGWHFRVVEDERDLVLQTRTSEGWRDVYAFSPQPVPRIDIELSNWFTSTHPTSRFVTGLIVSTQRHDGTRLSLSDWNELAFVVRTPEATTSIPVQREEVPELLAEHFDLPGYAVNGAGRIVPAGRGG